MTERILTLAKGITGAEDDTLLEALCCAAKELWVSRLRDGITLEVCSEPLCCAAAFTAAADYAAGQDGGGVSGFTAGAVSVQSRSGADRERLSAALRQTAERLMAPYAETGDFCFKGVRG